MKTAKSGYAEARLQISQERTCDACMTLTVAPFRKYDNAPNLNTSTVANRDGKTESEEWPRA
jgi:hypothetical protein